jgi:hypothetical protein
MTSTLTINGGVMRTLKSVASALAASGVVLGILLIVPAPPAENGDWQSGDKRSSPAHEHDNSWTTTVPQFNQPPAAPPVFGNPGSYNYGNFGGRR